MKFQFIYSPHYDISFHGLEKLHPFDGKKYSKSIDRILKTKPEFNKLIQLVDSPIDDASVQQFSSEILYRLLKEKKYVTRALEIPLLSFLPYSLIHKHILLPMQYAVQGTYISSVSAIEGINSFQFAGGYHHACDGESEGFCIYNDIGISVLKMLNEKTLKDKEKILIIDVDAHHGNGNAETFFKNDNIFILDIFNKDIYPTSSISFYETHERVNYPVELSSGTGDEVYLSKLKNKLHEVREDKHNFKFAYINAGTDIYKGDKLGQLNISKDGIKKRDEMITQFLIDQNIPFVYLLSGGYSTESYKIISDSILNILKKNAPS